MQLRKIISKSKDGEKMEVIATEGHFLHTFHIQRYSKDWKYCAGYEKGRMILGKIELKSQ